ncbi:MAG TPA: hypothetical protein VHO25_12405 [Polyangiaceae bacterium]|nr:hypothetical protein [Polyangiaceae bacterium]
MTRTPLKQAKHLRNFPASIPISAEQVLEFHAARLLLLLHVAGQQGAIEGLTKLAKLDFFVRYPEFFERAIGHRTEQRGPVESAMMRYRYGPWDPRYYDVLAFLESRDLLKVRRHGKSFGFSLTATGSYAAGMLSNTQQFAEQIAQISRVAHHFGDKTGNWLKNHIYSVFDAEVTQVRLGEVIE